MSWNTTIEPGCPDDICLEADETPIVPCSRVLGDFDRRRALSVPKRQNGGPTKKRDEAGIHRFAGAVSLALWPIRTRPKPHAN